MSKSLELSSFIWNMLNLLSDASFKRRLREVIA